MSVWLLNQNVLLQSFNSRQNYQSNADQTDIILACQKVTILYTFSYRRNILPTSNSSYLRGCQYHHTDDPLCPIFRLGAIVNGAGVEFNDIAYKVCDDFWCSYALKVVYSPVTGKLWNNARTCRFIVTLFSRVFLL